ncbi:alpha/beta hydrolase [Kitasatospora sp. NPDC049258]|uniref:alpha/beta hydrolase n=1 Tax=Kitasatospora sp. NPDC049258 TaxID=3155394 RepID=UPI00341DCED3
MSPVYRQFDRAELDREYSPSSCVADLAAELAAYTEGSAAAHAAHPARRDERYGEQPPELLDYFPAAGPGAPLHVFVHGGYWQELDKADSAFAAPDFLRRGTAFAAIGYGLAPRWPPAEIVAQVRRAVRWLFGNAEELGFDPARVYLSGSSAGAHLAAMALLDPEPAPGHRIAGAALLSGVYDLEPISLSYVNEPLALDAEAARRLSPLHLPLAGLPPLLIARGEHETAEFARQQEEFAAAARAAGVPVHTMVAAGRNHFDLPLDLGRPESELGAEVLGRFGA